MKDHAQIQHRGGESVYLLSTCLVAAWGAVLIWTMRYPPLADYPNHLARCYILFHLRDVPEFREWYVAHWAPVPNLAMDALVYLLQYAFSIEVAGKIVLSLAVALFAAGAIALSRAWWGRVLWSAPLIASFVYSSMLFYGFMNHLLGVGLYLCLLAVWWRWAPAISWVRVLVTLLFAAVCFLAHLSAYICFIVSVLLYFLLLDRHTLRALGYAVLLAGVFFVFRALGSDTQYDAPIVWNTLEGKLRTLITAVRTYSWKLDVAYLLLLILGIAAFLRVERPLRWSPYGVTLSALLALLYAVLPKGMATASGVDSRFILPATIIFLLSVTPGTPALSRRGRVLVCGVYALVLLNLGHLSWVWKGLDAEAQRYAQAFPLLQQGSWVYPLVVLPDSIDAQKRERTFSHLVHYAVISRKVFSPGLFTLPGQHPLRRKIPEPYRQTVVVPTKVDWQPILSRYDYLWCYNFPTPLLQPLEDKLRLVWSEGKVNLYAIRRVGGRGE